MSHSPQQTIAAKIGAWHVAEQARLARPDPVYHFRYGYDRCSEQVLGQWWFTLGSGERVEVVWFYTAREYALIREGSDRSRFNLGFRDLPEQIRPVIARDLSGRGAYDEVRYTERRIAAPMEATA